MGGIKFQLFCVVQLNWPYNLSKGWNSDSPVSLPGRGALLALKAYWMRDKIPLGIPTLLTMDCDHPTKLNQTDEFSKVRYAFC